MTYDEIKQIYETCGEVGVKLCADDFALLTNIDSVCGEIPEVIPYLNNTVTDWRTILVANPQYIQHCPIKDQFDNNDWAILVAIQGSLADECPWHIISGAAYAWIIQRQPQLLKTEYLNKLDSHDWAHLLLGLPHLRDDPRIQWGEFTGYEWYSLVDRYSEFYSACDWEKLSSLYWHYLLREDRPTYDQILDYFNNLSDKRKEELRTNDPGLFRYQNNIFKKKKNNEEN
jgi:hypothetical protein